MEGMPDRWMVELKAHFSVLEEVPCAEALNAGKGGAADTHTHAHAHTHAFAYRCGSVSRMHGTPGIPNGLLISVPTAPPHETVQITNLTALNSPRPWRAYTEATNRNHPLFEGQPCFRPPAIHGDGCEWRLRQRQRKRGRPLKRGREQIKDVIKGITVLHENALVHGLKAAYIPCISSSHKSRANSAT